MKRSSFKEKIGFKFIRNKQSKEFHRVKNIGSQCGIDLMSEKNGAYCTWLFAVILMLFKNHNGCTHCYSKKDTDKK